MLKQNTQRLWEYEKTTNRVAEVFKRRLCITLLPRKMPMQSYQGLEVGRESSHTQA